MDATEEDVDVSSQERGHVVVFFVPLPSSFDFCLLPWDEAHSDAVEKHRSLVYHGLCEIFFDLALYPCVLDIAITGRGFTFTKKLRVDGADAALDVWEQMHNEMKERWRQHVSWMSVEVSRLNRKLSHPPVSGLACYEEMTTLQRSFLASAE